MTSFDLPPATHLTNLLDLIEAWQKDEDRVRSSSSAPSSALAPLLWQQVESWAQVIPKASKHWSAAERKDVAAVFDKRLRASNGTWMLRHAISQLQRDAQKTLVEHLQLALMQAGCWERLPRASERPDLSVYGSYAKALNDANTHGHAEILRHLLAWEGSGLLSQELLTSYDSGVGLPQDMQRSQQTGWAWLVRNASEECLRVWLDAGASPNAVDKSGVPVLAYAHKPYQLHLLLDAGADPLGLHLPFATRQAHLRALWMGWTQLRWDEGRKASEREWEAGVDYLRTRLAQWPPEEAHRATAPLASDRYNDACNTTSRSNGSELDALVQAMGHRAPSLPEDEAVWSGRTWSFAGAAARARLLDLVRSGSDALPPLPTPPPGREVVPGVPEATITALAQWPHPASAADAMLQQHGPAAIAGSLRLLMEDLSGLGRGWDSSVLHQCVSRTLQRTGAWGDDWTAAMASVVDGVFDTLYGSWPSSAVVRYVFEKPTRLGLKWLQDHQDQVPVAQQGRWLALSLGAYEDKDSEAIPEREWAKTRLVELAQGGWSPDALPPADRGAFVSGGLRRYPEFAEAFTAAQTQHRLAAEVRPTSRRRTKPRM